MRVPAYVDGDSLVSLILEVRSEFEGRRPYEPDMLRPNSVRCVALDVLESKSTDEQLQVLRDLLDLNLNLMVTRDSADIFMHADTPAAYLMDLVSEVIWQVLVRDPTIQAEDERRLDLAAACGSEFADA